MCAAFGGIIVLLGALWSRPRYMLRLEVNCFERRRAHTVFSLTLALRSIREHVCVCKCVCVNGLKTALMEIRRAAPSIIGFIVS